MCGFKRVCPIVNTAIKTVRAQTILLTMRTVIVHFTKTTGRSASSHRYESATDFIVTKEGTLIVKGEKNEDVGVYSADNWVDAYFEDAVGSRKG
ncbi:hypothetical protein ACWEK5_40475 [Rhodococcus koreensis]